MEVAEFAAFKEVENSKTKVKTFISSVQNKPETLQIKTPRKDEAAEPENCQD